jgi:hypothetical protein
MKIALLNWKGAENDVFTKINEELKYSLELFNNKVFILNIDFNIAKNIYDLNKDIKIDLVITHQGIYSDLRLQQGNQLLWDVLKIKLLCLHSDHPSICPENHQVDSRFVIHTYCADELTKFANITYIRNNPAITLPLPSFYQIRDSKIKKVGNFFVFPKNLDSVSKTLEKWEKKFPLFLSNFFIECSNQIKNDYLNTGFADTHQIIKIIKNEDLNDKLKNHYKNESIDNLLIAVHGELDKVYRNMASEFVIKELWDIPLKINGRGWDEFKLKKSPQHEYFNFSNVIDGDYQFYSNYGIIDIVPNKNTLHDRTLRAVSHKGSFLSNSILYSNEFSTIFFNGKNHDLMSKAKLVIDNPNDHNEICKKFGELLYETSKFSDFSHNLEKIIKFGKLN